MKIFWTDFASEMLIEIFDYYKQNINTQTARKIKLSIFQSTKQLISNPKSGQIEECLKHLSSNHRYLVCGNYKIIYREVKEGILITDVFDSRQQPEKLNNPKRKSTQ